MTNKNNKTERARNEAPANLSKAGESPERTPPRHSPK